MPELQKELNVAGRMWQSRGLQAKGRVGPSLSSGQRFWAKLAGWAAGLIPAPCPEGPGLVELGASHLPLGQ